jgi:hypothetical protein
MGFPAYGTHAPGDEIGRYGFDEDVGLWIHESTGTIDDEGWFQATIPHFSWWNGDKPISAVSCISGTLEDSEGHPVSRGTVRLIGIDWMGSEESEIESDGSYCVNASPESENEIYMVGKTYSTSPVWVEASFEIASGPGGVECGGGTCMDAGVTLASEMEHSCLSGTITGDLTHLDEFEFTYSLSTDGFGTDEGVFVPNEDFTFCVPATARWIPLGRGSPRTIGRDRPRRLDRPERRDVLDRPQGRYAGTRLSLHDRVGERGPLRHHRRDRVRSQPGPRTPAPRVPRDHL